LINEDIVTEDSLKTSQNVNVNVCIIYKYKVYISYPEISLTFIAVIDLLRGLYNICYWSYAKKEAW